MTLTAFFLILASVVLHALWHFISKSQKPMPAFYILISGSCLCTLLPLLPFAGVDLSIMPARFWLIAAGGGICGLICDVGLARAYRLSDVSLAYPLARALPVIFTALTTTIFGIGARPSPLTLFGMFVITLGCILMPMKNFSDLHWKNYCNRAIFGILIAAVGTTGYTIFDSEGLRLFSQYQNLGRWHNAIGYYFLREGFLFISLCTFVFSIPFERKFFTKELFRHPHPYFAGFFAALAYILVLMATGMVTNVSYVQAFRQMSLPIGMLLGILFLKEKCTLTKVAGITLIIGGLIITVL